MGGDWYLDSIDEVLALAEGLRRALDRTDELLSAAREQRLAGEPLGTIIRQMAEDGGKPARHTVDDAYRDWTAAISAYRASAIRAVVDEEGMSHSDVARLAGVSRQMIGRLYRSASPTS